jgi:hypothetical protein
MRLLNFELDGEVSAIVLRGLGLEWDLHNFAKFTGLTLDVSSDSLLLKWSVPPATNPWGCRENHAAACGLLFRGVRLIQMLAGDPEDAGGSNDITLSGVSKSIPGETEFRFKEKWDAGEPFYLLFELVSGRSIEIDADTVELVADPL